MKDVFNRDKWKKWLSEQDDNRRFDYMAVKECAVASFVKETTGDSTVKAGGYYVSFIRNGARTCENFPEWLLSIINNVRLEGKHDISIEALKEADRLQN